jgi:heme exporter protein A
VDASPSIEARGLTKLFGPLPALDDLDLTVKRGESVAIFGPNGAGKTTLLRILTLALRPTSGTLRVAGLDPRADDGRIRASTGLISHRSLLYDELTARENLLFFARLYGVADPERRAGQLLAEVDLETRAEDLFGTFSQGMRQRLALARCLVHDPTIVFMDEPFSGLDPHAAEMLRGTLSRLRSEGRTVLVTTHNLAQGLELSDRWILLGRGRLIAQGDSAAVDPHTFEQDYRQRLSGVRKPRSVPR